MKFLLIMQLSIILLIATFFQASASLLAQNVTIKENNIPLEKVFKLIKKQTNYKFLYNIHTLKSTQPVSVSLQNATIQQALITCLEGQPLSYIIEEQTIIIKKKPFSLNAAVQDITVSGKIVDETGETLPGVSVKVKGSQIGVVSNIKGEYKILVPDNNSVLVFSFIGYEILEKSVGANTTLNVSLRPQSKGLEEVVVVVGYGTQRKINTTGAISSVGSKELLQSPVANISNSLVGRVSGITGVQGSGEPGNDQSKLRIRGVGTYNGNTEPLVLLDGIQITLAEFNRIDPNEVETVTALKDASSTAVYGIRGANGVLLVTTKVGRTGKPTVNYSYNYARNSFTDIKQMMNSYDFANSFNQALYNDQYIKFGQEFFTPKYDNTQLEKYRTGSDPILYPNVDWFKLMYKESSAQQQHNLNIRGGTDKAKYFISAGYFDQGGLFNNTDLVKGYDPQIKFNRFNFRSNLDFDITKKLKMTFKLSTQTTTKKGTNIDRVERIIDNVFKANPLSAPGIIDDKIVILDNNLESGDNPLLNLFNKGYRTDFGNNLNGTVRLDHSLDFITKGLTTHGQVAYQVFNSQATKYERDSPIYRVTYDKDGKLVIDPATGQPVLIQAKEDDVLKNYSLTADKLRNVTSEFALNYARSFNQHSVTAMALYNQTKTFDPDFTDKVPSAYQSFVGRTTYAFRNRYMMEVNLAYNGSENFAPGKRFGVFPSYSLGWVASEESFFPKNKIVSFLKFRGSYGEVGNDRIGENFFTSNDRFLYKPTAFVRNSGNEAYFSGLSQNGYRRIGDDASVREAKLNNPFLTWERSIKSNLGLEAMFLNSKINFTLDLFKETRDNILSSLNTISGTAGVVASPENLGKMENKGFEFDLGFTNNDKAFKYYLKGNFSFARNKILEQDELTRDNAYQYREGHPYRQNFGLIAEGFFNSWEQSSLYSRPNYSPNNSNRMQPGDVKYKDVNGDGLIDRNDEVPIGFSSIPEITYGSTLGASFKGFDLSLLFQGAGNVSFDYGGTRRNQQAFMDKDEAAAVQPLLESWTAERYAQGLPIKYPRFAVGNAAVENNNYRGSTLWVVDGSYLRLKNIEVGYSLPATLFKRIGLKSTRLFVNGNNIYTWKKVMRGVDPENENVGTNLEPYPLTRTVNFGANISF